MALMRDITVHNYGGYLRIERVGTECQRSKVIEWIAERSEQEIPPTHNYDYYDNEE